MTWRVSLFLHALLLASAIEAFVVAPRFSSMPSLTTMTRLFESSTSSLPEVSGMRVGEIRKELESYGISTKAFLEKKEMVQALEKARAEGKQPINGSVASESPKAETKAETVNGASDKVNGEAAKKTSPSGGSRSERIQQEMEKAKQMSVGELRDALKNRGIRTTSFFEKSEFVKAYAEAVVDGVDSSTKQKASTSSAASNEPYDASYRDVVVQKIDKNDQTRLLQGAVIDIKI